MTHGTVVATGNLSSYTSSFLALKALDADGFAAGLPVVTGKIWRYGNLPTTL